MRPGPSSRRSAGYLAFLGHRLSGLALVLFLPVHFFVLGLALEGSEPLDPFLAFADLPIVKVAEWGLMVLLTTHLLFGARLLVIELGAWRGLRTSWIGWGIGVAAATGLAFLMVV